MISKNSILFDIETGGLFAKKSQILSLAFTTPESPDEPALKGASLEPGTRLSRWSENKVWEPLKQRKDLILQKERNLLGQFLKVLETAPAGTQLVGWNIGYVPAPQEKTKAGGFDIPFIMSRARRYGMESQFRNAFRRHNIEDLGAKWSYKIAKEVAGPTGRKLLEEGVLHPDLRAEAIGFMKQAGKTAGEQGIFSEDELAQSLSRQNIRFSGWKQELVYEILTGNPLEDAHEASADVKALRTIMSNPKQEVGESFLRKWAPMALKNKFVSMAKFVHPSQAERTPQRYASIMAEAKKWNLDRDVENTLRLMARESGTSFDAVQKGQGIAKLSRTVRSTKFAEKFSKFGMSEVSEFWQHLTPSIRKNWGIVGIAAGLTAATVLEIGTYFSGSDDNHNTIEGLRHGGKAQELRKMLTDFGSGWIRKAISKGIDLKEIASAAGKLGVGKTGFSQEAFSGVMENMLRKDASEAVRFAREAQGITVEGQRWIFGKKLGEGAVGEVWTGFRAGGQSQAGVIKTMKSKDIFGQYAEALSKDKRAMPESGLIVTGSLGNRLQNLIAEGDRRGAQKIADFAVDYHKEIAGNLNKHKMSSLQYEAAMTRAAKESAPPGRFVPEVFASSPEAMVMEMAGTSLSATPTAPREIGGRLLQAPPQIGHGTKFMKTEGLVNFLRQNVKGALEAKEGVVHLDPHLGNVMRRGASYTMIDYGVAVAATKKNLKGRSKIMAPVYENYLFNMSKEIQRFNNPLPGPVASEGGTAILQDTTGTAVLNAAPKVNLQDKLSPMTQTVEVPAGPAAEVLRKKLTDFGSPVNLDKATHRAMGMMKKSTKVVKEQNHSILEPTAAAAKRKTMMMQKHKEAMVKRSVYSNRPGRKHTRKAGSLVI